MATALPQRKQRIREKKNIQKVEQKAINEGVPKKVEESRIIQSQFDSNNAPGKGKSKKAKARARQREALQKARPIEDTNFVPPVSQIVSSLPRTTKRFRNPRTRGVNSFEKYLASMVDPENFGEELRIPDSYTGKTTAWKQLINFNLPLLIAGASSTSTGNIYDFNGRSNFPTGSFHVFPSHDPPS